MIATLPAVRLRLTLAILVLLAVWACGGGGVGTGGTGAPAADSNVTVGTINGFGSVIVGGVRFDDTSASVLDDDGDTSGRSALRLGQVVEVRGSVDATGTTGVAQSIRQVSEVRGFIRGIDATGGAIEVGGTRVKVVAATALDGFASFGDFRVGDLVEVYGFLDRSTATVVATRVERNTPQSGAARIKVIVIASNVDAGARRFDSSGTFPGVSRLTIDYAGAELRGLPGGITSGAIVRVLAAAPPAAGVLTATRVEAIGAIDVGSVSWARIEGRITRYTSLSSFDVDGVTVNGSGARFVDGTAADLALGRQVRIVGRAASGTITALEVRLRDIEDNSSGTDEAEVEGTIERFVSPSDFVVRSTRIDASAATFERGGASGLGNGVKVEVKGTLRGQVLRASSVKFE